MAGQSPGCKLRSSSAGRARHPLPKPLCPVLLQRGPQTQRCTPQDCGAAGLDRWAESSCLEKSCRLPPPAETQQPEQQHRSFGRAWGLQGGYQRSVIWVPSRVWDYIFRSQAQM